MLDTDQTYVMDVKDIKTNNTKPKAGIIVVSELESDSCNSIRDSRENQ